MVKFNLQREHVEIAVGGSLLFISFFLSLLMVIRVIGVSFVLCFLLLSSSLAGLIIGLHGIYGLWIRRRRG
ncbi:hypothetical protein DRO58_01295 [Candidatus Bathyarchaeota archaeon]|nr:MAG: hypothetical protein DRO58_01295 [Candidatus Bathyarchaeota archaeon]